MSSATVDELISAADERLDSLLALADAERDRHLGLAYEGRRTADVLTHLHAWHLLFFDWIEAENAGEEPDFPAAGYTWRDLSALNDALYFAHRHWSYDEARGLLIESHGRLCALMRRLDDERLFDTEARPWLGHESLAEVAEECLGHHYAWGEGVIAKATYADLDREQ
ncbi:ClbS/DfsB family four-helix bundle protein [Demequina sp. NBRC 110051]|uniref:ClbS/DfsB family four-helix bundle protein n=1 Tax=Demequina sp. NBRC 110051 TaxID=1570340 RepID=UPI0013566DB9|nr:ClbS/DfsB family four-helix bundle protein [Demequina sp. NBRC 110051]